MLVDRTDSDAIERIAEIRGMRFAEFDGSRAAALGAGGKQSRSPLLLFLLPGALLEAGWIDEAAQFSSGCR